MLICLYVHVYSAETMAIMSEYVTIMIIVLVIVVIVIFLGVLIVIAYCIKKYKKRWHLDHEVNIPAHTSDTRDHVMFNLFVRIIS